MKRLRRVNVVALGLLVGGLAGLILGLITAWQTEAATPLLVVGLVLLLFPLVLSRDTQRVEATWGDFGVKVVRDVREALDESVRESDDSEDLKSRVASLEQALSSAETQLATVGAPARGSSSGGWGGVVSSAAGTLVDYLQRGTGSPPLGSGDRPVAAQHKESERSAVLMLSLNEEDPDLICSVAGPDGRRYEITPPRHFIIAGTYYYGCAFPQDFEWGPEWPAEGRYEVAWRSGTNVLAIDSFTFSISEQAAFAK